MKFYGIAREGHFLVRTALIQARKEFLSNIKDETLLIEDLKIYRPAKSQKQLGAWFGLFCKIVLTEFSDNGWDTSLLLKLDKPTGIEVSEGLLKEYMYSVCPMHNENGRRITMSDNDCDTIIMAKFFDDCRNFASSQWSIFVPEPDPKWREKNA